MKDTMRAKLFAGFMACGAVLLLPMSSGAQAACAGDCNGNGSVSISELVKGVNIALGLSPVASCPAFDSNGDDRVRISELVAAVNAALFGCPVVVAEFVGWQQCRGCHLGEYAEVSESGHPYKLNFLDGQPPEEHVNTLLTPNGNYPLDPPPGYDWSDISYVIGSWGWKVHFMNQEGYIITCPPGDTDADGDGYCDTLCAGSTPGSCDAAAGDAFEGQWNLYAEPGSADEWKPYHMGEFQKPYSCGSCHTTGYNPDVPTEGMPGIVGSWSDSGITCEACHGPGSLHAADPLGVDMVIDNSSEACGECHTRGGPESIPASGGFIQNHEQWDELLASPKHGVVECVGCHDPHTSAKFDLDAGLSDRHPGGEEIGIHSACEGCHPEKLAQQKSPAMRMLNNCIDCHMPRAAKSALAHGPFEGDVRSHLFAVNTDVLAPQFSEDGKTAMPYLTLDFACRSCHGAEAGDPQKYSVKTDAELEACADDYHDVE